MRSNMNNTSYPSCSPLFGIGFATPDQTSVDTESGIAPKAHKATPLGLSLPTSRE